MFKKIFKNKKEIEQNQSKDNISSYTLSTHLDDNIAMVMEIFKNDQTLIMRRFQHQKEPNIKFCVFYFAGMVNVKILNDNIIKASVLTDLSDTREKNLLRYYGEKVVTANAVKITNDVNQMIQGLYGGNVIFLMEGFSEGLSITADGYPKRSVSEPESAKVVRGPREGFTEVVKDNIAMVKRKIRNPKLNFIMIEVGTITKTISYVSYIEGVASQAVIDELFRRIKKIELDSIIDSGYIAEYMEDARYSPIETVGYTERPDELAAKLLDGRVALFVDGSPCVLTVPHLFIESFQANQDYYQSYILMSFNRIMRILAGLLCICVPSVYLAIVTYHQEMLPTQLLLSLAASRQGVPIPTALSLFIMLLIFDALREAGIRMPTPVGQAVNVVGTLVLGQAAVEAKLVSAPVVIITALTGIFTLININIVGSVVLYRFFLLLAASVLGIYGFLFGILIIILHLMSIRSFGVPFMITMTRWKNHIGQDSVIRVPWWAYKRQVSLVNPQDHHSSEKMGKGDT